MDDKITRQDIIEMRNSGIGENDGKIWTKADKKYLTEEYRNGMNLSQLAYDLQRSECAIVQQLISDKIIEIPECKKRNRIVKPKPNCESCATTQQNKKLKELLIELASSDEKVSLLLMEE